MEKITLSEIHDLLGYDQESGALFWKKKRRGRQRIGNIAGNKTNEGYIGVKIFGKPYLAHRIIWFMVYGKWPDGQIDHFNRIRDDNRLENLRDVSSSVNNQNRSIGFRNSCGHIGVVYHENKRKWQARIGINGRKKSLGYFDSPENAGKAYMDAKEKYHDYFQLNSSNTRIDSGYETKQPEVNMGKIIERVRHQQLKRAMNEIDERRSAEYLESSKRQKEYFAKQMQDLCENLRMIDERLEAEKRTKAEKPKSFIKWLFTGKL